MQRIGLVFKSSEEKALVLAEEISRFLVREGREVLLEAIYRDAARRWKAATSDRISDEADLLVVLGGDGTILRAAALLNDKSIPIFGINLGRVGYMTEVLPENAIEELHKVLAGAGDIVKRMMLQVTLPDGTRARALNDAVIHWAGIARLIDLGVTVGDAREIEVRADGLIVSTPIGSSAYSYAANGPLVHPEIEAIILTPICPYRGLTRPLVIPADRETTIVTKRGENVNLTLDGHTQVPLRAGQSIGVQRCPVPFLIVRSKTSDYFEVLEEKLGLEL